MCICIYTFIYIYIHIYIQHFNLYSTHTPTHTQIYILKIIPFDEEVDIVSKKELVTKCAFINTSLLSSRRSN